MTDAIAEGDNSGAADRTSGCGATVSGSVSADVSVDIIRASQTLVYLPRGWEATDASGNHPVCASRIRELAVGERIMVYLPNQAGFPILRIVLKNFGTGPVRQAPFRTDAPDPLGWQQQGSGDSFVDVESVRSGGLPFAVSSFSHAYGGAGGPLNEAGVQLAPGVTMTYFWEDARAPQSQWRAMRAAASQLARWLATPPDGRDNGQTEWGNLPSPRRNTGSRPNR